MNLELKIQARDIAKNVQQHDIANYVLKHAGVYPHHLLKAIAVQLEFNKSIKKKIPAWADCNTLLAHESINLEQSSSEITATYKASKISGEKGLDLSGGLGVDSFFFLRKFSEFTYNEPNGSLAEIVTYNFRELGVDNCTFSSFEAEEFRFENSYYDFIYLDPSRRNAHQQKVVSIEDCIPNLLEIKDRLLEHSNLVMVKYSPMMDISLGIKLLQNVFEIWVLADKNEVKELVFLLKKVVNGHNPLVRCVNLATNEPELEYLFLETSKTKPIFSPVQKYLYEPNAAILKAGAFNVITQKYGVKKIAQNSHLYTSDAYIVEFPGRILEVLEVTNYDKSRLNEYVPDKRAHVVCRNFPVKPDEIKKKMGWVESGAIFCYFTQDINHKKIVIITKKI